MFNPYVGSAAQSIRPAAGKQASGGLGAGLGSILSKLGNIDTDDLLMLLLVYLLVKEGEADGVWPLVAAMLYLIL